MTGDHPPSKVESDKCFLLKDGASFPLILFYDIGQQSPTAGKTKKINHKHQVKSIWTAGLLYMQATDYQTSIKLQSTNQRHGLKPCA